MKYRNKKTGEIIEAHRWFKNGDHPLDDVWRVWETGEKLIEPREGKVVRYFRHPGIPGEKKCALGCGFSMHRHGWIDNSYLPGYVSEDGIYSMPVCPGDYVISHWNGKAGAIISYRTYEPVHPKEFEEKYEAVKEPAKNIEMYGEVLGFGTFTELKCPSCCKKILVNITLQQVSQ